MQSLVKFRQHTLWRKVGLNTAAILLLKILLILKPKARKLKMAAAKTGNTRISSSKQDTQNKETKFQNQIPCFRSLALHGQAIQLLAVT